MSPQNSYRGLILTNHALDRMRERGLSREYVYQTFQNPGVEEPGKNPDTIERRKRIGEFLVTLVTKQTEKGEWIIISAWMDPPLPGTRDFRKNQAWKEYQKASPLKKFLLTLLKQFGF